MRSLLRREPIAQPLSRREAIEYKIFVGKGTVELIKLLVELRIHCFREYPHLYSGSRDNAYEKEVAEELSRNEHTTIVTAYYGSTMVGFTTAFPLVNAAQILEGDDPTFLRSGHRPSDFYYWSEAAIAPQFRGYGILSRFSECIESRAVYWGYRHMCLATIIRDENDARKPHGYRRPDPLWQRFGYMRTDIQFHYWWPTLTADGSTYYSPNKHSMWLKCNLRKRKTT